MFYHYHQNNSGGQFELDNEAGLAPEVIIEANDVSHANRRAVDIGLYFNGVAAGKDCPCCGDRWAPALPSDGAQSPEVYGRHAAAFVASDKFHWAERGREVAVHYLDGRVEWY